MVNRNKKKEIMEMLAKGNSFQATQWLKSPHAKLQNKTPAEAMQEERVEIVFEILKEDRALKKK
jgi:uncharacterized protein (DUF2384 family)|tara:strand:- start:174 stop:365 length:192 start_codon:yes stop_codon:yes gene_type:complete